MSEPSTPATTSTTPTTSVPISGSLTPVVTPSQKIYTLLTRFLHPTNPTPFPPQLEILPPALAPPAPDPQSASSSWPLLISPPHLGIPKKALIQAFVVAREIFFRKECTEQGEDGREGVEAKMKENEERCRRRREKLEAATVLLLFDPEHVTAANYHREYFAHSIKNSNESGPESGPGSPLAWGITAEMTLLEGLLTSPGLDKHSKSPTLWSLLRWLVRKFGVHRARRRSVVDVDEGVQVTCGDAERRLSQDVHPAEIGSKVALQREHDELMKDVHHSLGIVKQAGGIHARNYHAWQYARFILTHLLPPQQPPPSIASSTDSTNTFTATLRSSSLHSLTQTHFNHSLLHPTDTSIWSFLHFLLTTYPPETTSLTIPILSQTLSTLSELHPPRRGVVPRDPLNSREAIWNFMRMCLGGGQDGLGVVRLPIARKGLLRRIEEVAFMAGVGEEGRGARGRGRGSGSGIGITSSSITTKLATVAAATAPVSALPVPSTPSRSNTLGESLTLSEEDKQTLANAKATGSHSPLLVDLDSPEKPVYLEDRNFAWRGYIWIMRRGEGDWRAIME